MRHPLLPKDPRTVLKTCTTVAVTNIEGGCYYHFGLANGITALLDQFSFDDSVIQLQINVDGVPVNKSTNAQFWPILGLVANCVHREPFIIGLYYGNSKPYDVSEYLKEFVNEYSKLLSDRLVYKNKSYNIVITAVMCDTPARAFIKNIKGHSGYSGCDKCTQHGVYFDRRMTFPEMNAPLRTDESFIAKVGEDHHLGSSPFCEFSIGMISNFPADYMHLICLGVVRKLLNLWIIHISSTSNTIRVKS